MTTAIEAVRTVLVADAAVAALVVARIYSNKLTQDTTFPAIRMQVITDVPELTFTSTDLSNIRLQVDCYAPMYLDAHAVGDAVKAVLDALAAPAPGLSAFRINSSDLFEDATQLHCVRLEYSLWR